MLSQLLIENYGVHTKKGFSVNLSHITWMVGLFTENLTENLNGSHTDTRTRTQTHTHMLAHTDTHTPTEQLNNLR